ncbi:MAG: 3-oxoacyl-ACP reductase FabG [Clostridiales bacterium]|nr:3-oxoacyl-ACP reductase FabG [Clostridiales bacterium]
MNSCKKTALITGASGGIGSAAAELLARSDFNIAVHYNKSYEKAYALTDRLLKQGTDACAFMADISEKSEADRLFGDVTERFGGVDVLVNNAGVAHQKLFTDTTDGDFKNIFGVNIGGTVNCCRAAIPYMVHKKSGKIINISSMWGVAGASCEALYSSSKAAVIGLTKALAKELGPSGIQVNCVAPGVIDTEMNKNLTKEDMDALINDTPLSRIGTPRDVAEAILFFASPSSDFITGQVLCVDGGFIL